MRLQQPPTPSTIGLVIGSVTACLISVAAGPILLSRGTSEEMAIGALTLLAIVLVSIGYLLGWLVGRLLR